MTTSSANNAGNREGTVDPAQWKPFGDWIGIYVGSCTCDPHDGIHMYGCGYEPTFKTDHADNATAACDAHNALIAEVERLRGYAKDFAAMYDDLYRCGWLNADLIERYGGPVLNARRALGAVR